MVENQNQSQFTKTANPFTHSVFLKSQIGIDTNFLPVPNVVTLSGFNPYNREYGYRKHNKELIGKPSSIPVVSYTFFDNNRLPPLYGDFKNPTSIIPFYRYQKPKRDAKWDKRYIDIDEIQAKKQLVHEAIKQKNERKFSKQFISDQTKAFNMSNVTHKHPVSSKGYARNVMGGYYKDFQKN